MEKATIEYLQEIFGTDGDSGSVESEWVGDNFYQGLMILAKYHDPLKETVIHGADHDIVYGPDVDFMIERGLTKEDAYTLAKLNWIIDEDGNSFNCFV